MTAVPCPDREMLERLARADLSHAEETELAGHCENCQACHHTLQEIERRQAGALGLDQENQDTWSDLDPPNFSTPPTIGPYEVLKQIGRGGMGVVLLAEQKKPLSRRVAIKLIKPGMDSQEVLSRFDIERRALAVMDHPAIARVHDAGTTDDGRPYFVMEYVDGAPITDFCEQEKLTVAARIELMIRICEGVQHAHQKGIIHRDLKPRNILVKMQDGNPMPFIIDFGIAKAIDLPAETRFTHYGMLVGTPEYMSPEQSDPAQIDVDTRSDVYCLGLILYEILTGTRPFSPPPGESLDLLQLMHRIREEEPQRPSSRVRRLAAEPNAETSTATSVPSTTKLKGDLDRITLKTLEKRPDRRYQSASALADDLTRYLTNQPVAARPASLLYILSKIARRHRAAFLGGIAVLLTLMAGIASTLMFAYRERNARIELARQVNVSKSVLKFLSDDFFALAVPDNEPDRNISFREVIDRATDVMLSRTDEDAEVRCTVLLDLGRVYFDLGEYERSRQLFEESARDSAERLGERHTIAMTSLDQLGKSLLRLRKFDAAEKVLLKALKLQRSVLGPEHKDTVHTYAKLGDLYGEMSRLDDAVRITEEVLETRRRLWGDEYEFTLTSMNGLGLLYRKLDRHEDAARMFLDAKRVGERTLGPEHSSVLTHSHNLALAYLDLEKFAEANELAEKCLEVKRRILPPGHDSILYATYLLGTTRYELGKHDLALKMFEETIKQIEQFAPHDKLLLVASLMENGKCLTAMQRFEDAEKKLKASHQQATEHLNAKHRLRARVSEALAHLYQRWGKPQEARKWQ